MQSEVCDERGTEVTLWEGRNFEELIYVRVCWAGALPYSFVFFFFQAEDGIRDPLVTGVQTCALPICAAAAISSIGLPPSDQVECVCRSPRNTLRSVAAASGSDVPSVASSRRR